MGTLQVRDILEENFPVSNREIEDSLWHYYYDVDKTVNYLISTVLCGRQFSCF